MKIRPALSDEIVAFCGGQPSRTLRGALIAVQDGEPMALAAYYVDRSRAVVVSDIRMNPKEARRHGRAWFRGAQMLLEEVRLTGLPVYAVADEDWPRSERFLARFGFVDAGKGVWAWLS